ncbi:MAG TPA: hypothetical protein VMA83_06820 [Solirubrobacteraceae bacterium]|nr:hypothetical protein [Solirubrobacteraceae bacterium]
MADEREDESGEGSAQPDPRARLMHEVAAQMDVIESEFGDDFQIGRVITIVEVVEPNGNVGMRVRSAQLPWVTIGMLHIALKSVESQLDT